MAANPQFAFSGYAPHPDIPGAYNFTPSDGGNPILAAGPEAERMRAMLDRYPSTPAPQQVADNTDYMGAAGAMFGGAPQPPQAPPSATDVMHGVGAVFAGGAQQPVPPPAAPPPAPAPVMRDAIPRPTDGAAPVTPQGPVNPGPNPQDYLVHTHTKAGYVPTAQKVVTEGGVQDPELAKAMGTAYADKMRADATQADADKLLAMHQVQQSQIASAEAAKAEDDMRQKRIANIAAQEEATKEYSRVMGDAQKDLEKASTAEVDPERIWRGKDGARIGAAIAAGLGAFGANLGHTPNFALDIITRQIDRDVDSQRDAINRGVAAKNNNILRIRDKYNVDTSTAEKLYSVFATSEAQALARKQAALQGGAEAQQRFQAIDAGLAARKLKDLQDMQANLFGKAQITAEERYRQGGDVVTVSPTLKATAQAAGYLGQTGQGMGQAAAGAFQAQHEGSPAPKIAPAGGGKESPRISMKIATNESAREDLPALEKADAGGFIAPDIHGTGTEARVKLNAAVDALTSKLVDAAGDPLTESQLAHLREKLGSADPRVRAETRAALQHGTETFGQALGRASERSRGMTDSNTEKEEP